MVIAAVSVVLPWSAGKGEREREAEEPRTDVADGANVDVWLGERRGREQRGSARGVRVHARGEAKASEEHRRVWCDERILPRLQGLVASPRVV